MTRYGLTLSSEEHPPGALVDLAVAAEANDFDFVSISDHFHPWVTEQGHSPFVWAVLGAIARATDSIDVAVGVTCPLVRLHPVVVAQAAATTSLLFGGRFSFGIGSGEALNEHVLGDRWPAPEIRLAMLHEALGVMRRLWTGETVDHRGEFYEVENARLFDPPAEPLRVVVSGFGEASTELAAEMGDGYWGHSPEPDGIERYRRAGGEGPTYAQLRVCWAPDEDQARETVHRCWPNGGLSGQLLQDLPTWTHFEQATSPLTTEQVVGETPCGPDLEPFVELARTFRDAGYDHLYFHQVGPDQDGFQCFWREELAAAVRAL